ncbi:MAG: hypothetical protein JWP14_3245 [Frankiales bacterium]|nr:hypothetical protein [Frankiales bacterium]
MRMHQNLFSEDDLRNAVDAELDSPPKQLPPSSVNPALVARREELAEWAHGRLQSTFYPTREEIVAVSKAGHGVRPVALWDMPSRLAYWALCDRLRPGLPPVDRSRAAWKDFQRAPIDTGISYIVSADIASCYQFIDHELLASELSVQSGDANAVDAVVELLREVAGRRYGIPQQSVASDVIAEAFLSRLERKLVRRRLRVSRYNDDFRFACKTWSEVVRAIEVFAEEARTMGFTVNDQKTLTWGAAKYERSLDEADQLREEIAAEAELDLTTFGEDYDGFVVLDEPDSEDVDLLTSVRVLERWDKVAGRRRVAASRRAEHRAIVDLLPAALKTLEKAPGTDSNIVDLCMKLLRFERTTTPAVAAYLTTRDDEAVLLASFDKLLKAKAYLNGWQVWWLQQPLSRQPGFASGVGGKARIAWARQALMSAEHTPVLQAHAAMTLARHKLVTATELLPLFDRASETVQPVLTAALAWTKPGPKLAAAITGDSLLNRWTYDWAELFA